VLFEKPNQIVFDGNDMSNVSFINTDIAKVKFELDTRWGPEDKFKVIEEEWLENMKTTKHPISLIGILSLYRNLRENYEARLRYDEAGKFFIKEMELKRRYRESPSASNLRKGMYRILRGLKLTNKPEPDVKNELKKNGWWRRNIFSLIGWYYHLSRYGEDLLRPTLAGIVIVVLSTLLWLTQENPTLEPTLPSIQDILFHTVSNSSNSTSIIAQAFHNITTNTTLATPMGENRFVGVEQFGNGTQWQKAFERAIADFVPLLPLGSNTKVGVIDYVIKIAGGAVTFGLIVIALRRRFERKYTR
jgi:hypothetical protein